MIDSAYWQSAIASYATLILDHPTLVRAWVEQDTSKTSVTEFYELYEQIFDDLDAEDMLEKAEIDSIVKPFFKDFLDEIKYIDTKIESDDSLSDAATLLESEYWKKLISSAQTLINAIDKK